MFVEAPPQKRSVAPGIRGPGGRLDVATLKIGGGSFGGAAAPWRRTQERHASCDNAHWTHTANFREVGLDVLQSIKSAACTQTSTKVFFKICIFFFLFRSLSGVLPKLSEKGARNRQTPGLNTFSAIWVLMHVFANVLSRDSTRQFGPECRLPHLHFKAHKPTVKSLTSMQRFSLFIA